MSKKPRRAALAVDFGGTKIRMAVVDETGKVYNESQLITDAARGPEAVLHEVALELLKKMFFSHQDYEDLELVGCGIVMPGPLDPTTGVLQFAPNLPKWLDVPVVALLSEKLDRRVALENDASAAALGESRFGAGRDKRILVHYTLGTGIGGGIVVDGKLFAGTHGSAGEIGHTILQADGPSCACGSRAV